MSDQILILPLHSSRDFEAYQFLDQVNMQRSRLEVVRLFLRETQKTLDGTLEVQCSSLHFRPLSEI